MFFCMNVSKNGGSFSPYARKRARHVWQVPGYVKEMAITIHVWRDIIRYLERVAVVLVGA